MQAMELRVKVFLYENIEIQEASQELCRLIDIALLKNKKYNDFHKENKFKNYCFSTLYPLGENGVYKKDKLYSFNIRTIDKSLCEYLSKSLDRVSTNKIQILTISKKNINKNYIDKIKVVTPIVAKFEEGYWRSNYTVDTLEKRIRENIIKKYNEFYNTKIDEDFELFTSLKILNSKPLVTKYKNIKLLGDKIEFTINNEAKAQELMYFAIGAGLGEMNSRGFGFVSYKWL